MEIDKNTMSQRGCLGNLPATTKLVPIKESNTVVNFGFFSDKALDARRHKSVAIHSMIAPKIGETWKWEFGEEKKCTCGYFAMQINFWKVLGGQQCMIQKLCLHEFSPTPATSKIAQIDRRSSHPEPINELQLI